MSSTLVRRICLSKLDHHAFILIVVLSLISPAAAQRFKTVVEFNGTEGGNPDNTSLVEGADGNYYGTAAYGGNYDCNPHFEGGCGTVFRMTPEGQFETLYTFCLQTGCPDGGIPAGGLVLGLDGNFYGTTSYGGTNCREVLGDLDDCGTVYKITPEGQLTTLHTFCTKSGCPDGAASYASLFLAADGNFYGTTSEGGQDKTGTVFKITPTGTLTTLTSFTSGNGMYPISPLVEGPDGNFYSTTLEGGNQNNYCYDGCGSAFKMTPSGTVTFLYVFCVEVVECPDGAEPLGGLTIGNDGNLYGTTSYPTGSVFKLTPQGQLTTIYKFPCVSTGCPVGPMPSGPLTIATDGNFYGTAQQGGTGTCVNVLGCGVVYQLTPSGTQTLIHDFQGTDGSAPLFGVSQTTLGYFVGTAFEGAIDGPCFDAQLGCGTVFAFSTGLGPSVTFVNNPGLVGQTVGILGHGLTGTTVVSFHGVAASFSVVSDTYITATVPAGATSGYVDVSTPLISLRSNRPFLVLR